MGATTPKALLRAKILKPSKGESPGEVNFNSIGETEEERKFKILRDQRVVLIKVGLGGTAGASPRGGR